MTPQSKLEALITRAIEGGWKLEFDNWELDDDLSLWQMVYFEGKPDRLDMSSIHFR